MDEEMHPIAGSTVKVPTDQVLMLASIWNDVMRNVCQGRAAYKFAFPPVICMRLVRWNKRAIMT